MLLEAMNIILFTVQKPPERGCSEHCVLDTVEGQAVAACSTTSSPYLFIFIAVYSPSLSSLCSCFSGGAITGPFSLPVSLFSSSYLSSISILPTQFSSTLLIFSFIFLPVSCPHLSLSHRMLKSQWTGYKNMKSTSEKKSIMLSSFRPTGLVLIFSEALFPIVWFLRHPAVTLLSCVNPVVTGQ